MVATRGQKRKSLSEEKNSKENNKKDNFPAPSAGVAASNKNSQDMMDVDDKVSVENEQEQLLLADVLNHCRIIEKAVSIREYRSMGRIIRELNTIRKKVTPGVLKTVVAT